MREYNRLVFDDHAGATFRTTCPPMTTRQLAEHLRERLGCSCVTCTATRTTFAFFVARWDDGTRRDIVAANKPGH